LIIWFKHYVLIIENGGYSLISVAITAFISFISTNIDDLFVLMLLFTQINSVMKKRHIVIGQYLGIGILIAISIIGALGVALFPKEYVGLLGLVPIYLGIKAYIEHKKDIKEIENTCEGEHEDYNSEEETNAQDNSLITFTKSFVNPSIVKVAAVTVANGGDNIGIYISMFARMSFADILITVVIFTLLIALWCFISLKLSEYPAIQRSIEMNKHVFVPVVFIGLGIFILIESGAIKLIYDSVL
jgi:cadmium resistance transport/sequestration family protein